MILGSPIDLGELGQPKRIAFLGNYPPRLCGIATFTKDLSEAVAGAAPESDCFVAAVNDRKQGYNYPERVRYELEEGDLDSYRRTADLLNFNNADVLSVQHEFGIYGGPAGSHLLALLRAVRMPVVTTLHTILQKPNIEQRKVMDGIIRHSDRIVVMAQKGVDILRDVYDVPAAKIDLIWHGIPDLPFTHSTDAKAQFGVEGKDLLLTFGLIGPGKGIEHVIKALPNIVSKHPNTIYLILGATHPSLLAKEGERYRMSLEHLAADLGVQKHIIFHNRFVSPDDLIEFINATDVYITPYPNEEQITSGTLACVFGAGNAVVSTPYWHAKELLADDRGVLVPFRDPDAIANGVNGLLDDRERLEEIRTKAYAFGRKMTWPVIAKRYLESFRHARADHRVAARATFSEWTLHSRPQALPPLQLDHIERMSDGTGIFQHAIFNVPNFHEGYCTDDNARAFILCNRLAESGELPATKKIGKLATSYLSFLAAALNHQNGRFRNFMSHSRQWLEDAGSEDSHARAIWATGTGAGRSRNLGHRTLSAQLFTQAIPVMGTFTSPRAWTFSLLGIHEYLRSFPDEPPIHEMRQLLTEKLIQRWHDCATRDWPWFETSVTYDNARICQALILSGTRIPDPEALEIGLKSLRWLASTQTTQAGHFRPIGSNGFYQKNGARAHFDQQPIEAQAMVAACLEAFRASKEPAWNEEAKRAFEWFLGRNDLSTPLYDFGTGGCSDGLHEDRISENQGAESTLAFHLSLAEMNDAIHCMNDSTMLTEATP